MKLIKLWNRNPHAENLYELINLVDGITYQQLLDLEIHSEWIFVSLLQIMEIVQKEEFNKETTLRIESETDSKYYNKTYYLKVEGKDFLGVKKSTYIKIGIDVYGANAVRTAIPYILFTKSEV